MSEQTRPPRQSSSVILVRQGERDVEVFMTRRSPRSEFAASVYVFPGGSVRADDRSRETESVCVGCGPELAHRLFAERGGDAPPSPQDSLGLIASALRELYEEAGVLLAQESDGRPMDVQRNGRLERLGKARSEVEEGRLSLAALIESEGLQLAWRELIYFSHWITPRAFPIRFDTRFFLACLPEGQEALYGPREMTAGCWIAPREALARAERGDFPLVFATMHHLQRLCGPSTVEELMRFGREKPIRTVEPPTMPISNGPEPYLPTDEPSW